jgi:hypothetical protein
VPPRPQVLPWGEGLTKSRHATFAPSFAACFAAAWVTEITQFKAKRRKKHRVKFENEKRSRVTIGNNKGTIYENGNAQVLQIHRRWLSSHNHMDAHLTSSLQLTKWPRQLDQERPGWKLSGRLSRPPQVRRRVWRLEAAKNALVQMAWCCSCQARDAQNPKFASGCVEKRF